MLKRISLFIFWVIAAAAVIVAVFVLARWMIDATSGPPTTRP
jgi:hypothetical protein